MEIRHDVQALIQRDTTRYFLKTVIGEPIIDLEGDVAFKFFRYTKITIEADWALRDVWTSKIKDRRAELVEENQRRIKLVFAPTSDKIWNINAFNADPELNVRYNDESLHKNFSSGSFNFDSTIRVDQRDFFSLVDHRKQYESLRQRSWSGTQILQRQLNFKLRYPEYQVWSRNSIPNIGLW
jgi:hypothetical protein